MDPDRRARWYRTVDVRILHAEVVTVLDAHLARDRVRIDFGDDQGNLVAVQSIRDAGDLIGEGAVHETVPLERTGKVFAGVDGLRPDCAVDDVEDSHDAHCGS